MANSIYFNGKDIILVDEILFISLVSDKNMLLLLIIIAW
jgi:hypothetical protein